MSQHDMDLANQSGSLFRADLNNMAGAVATTNSGASSPSTTYARQQWADTSNEWLKIRNGANTSWIKVFRTDSGAAGRRPVVSKSTSYTVVDSDFGKVIRCTATLTLNLTAVSTLEDGFWFIVVNESSGNVTIDPNSSEQVNGATTCVIPSNAAALVCVDGSAVHAFAMHRESKQHILRADSSEVLRLQTLVDDVGDCYISFYDQSGVRKGYAGFTSATTDLFAIGSDENAEVAVYANANQVAKFFTDGHVAFGDDMTNTAVIYGKSGSASYPAINGIHSSATGTVATFRGNNASYGTGILVLACDGASSTGWAFFWAYSSWTGTPDLEFSLRGDGNGFCDGSFTGGGADFAEMCEWSDGNPNGEDRVGYSVTFLGDKIRIAQPGDRVFGVVSGNPTVVGNSAWNKWSEKYLRDDFGRYVMEDYQVVTFKQIVKGEPQIVRDQDGAKRTIISEREEEVCVALDKLNGVVPAGGIVSVQQRRKLNPEWDRAQTYIGRQDRKEWAAVGRCGRVRLRKGQCTKPEWYKIRDISDTVEEWWI